MKQPCQTTTTRVVERIVPDLAEPLHDNPLVHRLMAARGITDADQLNPTLADLPRPDSLSHIDLAVKRLRMARDQHQKVLIVGDYDCDGATSTTVAMLGLGMLGFRRLNYLIPNRFEHGYGLSPAIVDIASQEHHPDLILTVDNGVASVEGVARATELGIDVVVTDHHLPPEELPAAVAIINPNLQGSEFPGTNLAGVGVMFYTLLALRAALAKENDPAGKAPLANLLDLVAIGTVADVVPLDAINRILVEQGIRRIRAGHTRPGVLALLNVASRNATTMTTEDIGFGIGPRLNAAGRIDDMRIGVECLLSDDEGSAEGLATTLNSFNQKRRKIEQDMRETANEQLKALALDELEDSGAFSVCLYDEQWHQGVIGILAGRIKESLNRPVIIFTADDGVNLKGSARSIGGIHVRDVLQSIVTAYPDMIEKFGGHAMAAGLTLSAKHYEDFCEAFEQAVRQACDGQQRSREYLSDGALHASERTINNAQLLATLMPWGQGFEAPQFCEYFQVVSSREVGVGHLKLQLKPWNSTDSSVIEAIAFNCTVEPAPGLPVLAVYSLQINTYRERQSVQLIVHHLEQAALR